MTQLQKALARIKELESLTGSRCSVPRDKTKIGYYIFRRRLAAGLKSIDINGNASQIETRDGSCTLRTLKACANKLGCKAWEIVKEWEDANP